MIGKILEKLGVSLPLPILPPQAEQPPVSTSDWEVGQSLQRADQQLRRVRIHTDQAERIIKSWDDLLLPGGGQ